MKRNAILWATLCLFVFALALAGSTPAQQAAKVDGSWDVSMTAPNGNTFTQTVVFQQDGNNLKGTMKGRRGESPVEGKVDGNKISFTVTRDTPNGERKIEYNGTVDGDSIKGTVKFGENERDWTAKRSAPDSAPKQ
ncbi:MAG TPA: hypothetical protein VJR23_15485 [Candidatus Acidoferrales bacterium]|nr:hypothetical protein [Candidatus Acidoferrales bacterium]